MLPAPSVPGQAFHLHPCVAFQLNGAFCIPSPAVTWSPSPSTTLQVPPKGLPAMQSIGLLSVWPIQDHFVFMICCFTGAWPVMSHRLELLMVEGQFRLLHPTVCVSRVQYHLPCGETEFPDWIHLIYYFCFMAFFFVCLFPLLCVLQFSRNYSSNLCGRRRERPLDVWPKDAGSVGAGEDSVLATRRSCTPRVGQKSKGNDQTQTPDRKLGHGQENNRVYCLLTDFQIWFLVQALTKAPL